MIASTSMNSLLSYLHFHGNGGVNERVVLFVGRLLAVCRLTVGRQSVVGSCSSQLLGTERGEEKSGKQEFDTV